MAALEELVDMQYIQELVRRGLSHANIAEVLQQENPGIRGFSSRSVRRFCQRHSITRIIDNELDGIVGDFVAQYGHTYGRALIQGSVRARIAATVGAVSQRRVSNFLRRVAPEAFEAKTRDLIERTNPIPYYAPYFGYKVHMDQNEKIAQTFGCTHLALIDGCSRRIIGYSSMPVKNPILNLDLDLYLDQH